MFTHHGFSTNHLNTGSFLYSCSYPTVTGFPFLLVGFIGTGPEEEDKSLLHIPMMPISMETKGFTRTSLLITENHCCCGDMHCGI